MKADVIYSSDNGQLICIECAGASARYTGRDISGQAITKMRTQEAKEWRAYFGRPLACECGKTKYEGDKCETEQDTSSEDAEMSPEEAADV